MTWNDSAARAASFTRDHDSAKFRPSRLGRLFAAALAAAVSAWGLAVQATPLAWNAGTDDWHTAGNWLPVQIPGPADTLTVDNGGTAQLAADTQVSSLTVGGTSGGSVHQTAGNAFLSMVIIAPGTSGSGSYTLDGGDFSPGSNGLRMSQDGGTATATFTMNGGTFSAGQVVRVAGNGFNPGGAATFHLNGGTMNITSNPLEIGTNNDSTGVFNAAGGTLNLNSQLLLGHSGTTGGGTMNISSGSVTQTFAYFQPLTFINPRGTIAVSGTGNLSLASSALVFGGLVDVTGGSATFNDPGVPNRINVTLNGGSTTGRLQLAAGSASPTNLLLNNNTALTQTGGAYTGQTLNVGAGATHTMTGGTAQVAAYALAGTLDFGASTGPKLVVDAGAADATVDLSLGTITYTNFNLGQPKIEILGSNSLLIATLAQQALITNGVISHAGTIHIAGNTLHVPTGTTRKITGNFVDPVWVEGTLTGTANLSGGAKVSGLVDIFSNTLTVNNLTSEFTGSANVTANEIHVGTAGGSGLLTLLGSPTVSTEGIRVGDDGVAPGTGKIVQNGGAVTTRRLRIAEMSGSNGEYEINGGTLFSSDPIDLALNAGTASGVMNINGGIVSNGHSMRLASGFGSGGTAIVNLNAGGTINSFGGFGLYVARSNNATADFNVAGGTASLNSVMEIGHSGSTGLGRLNVSAGNMTQTLSFGWNYVFPRGEINVTGGSLSLLSPTTLFGGDIDVSGGSASFGTVTLQNASAAGIDLTGGVTTIQTLNLNGQPLSHTAGRLNTGDLNGSYLQQGGEFSPIESTATISAGYTMTPPATLVIEISGAPADPLNDVLSVTGVTALDGTLMLDFTAYPNPAVGSLYTFLTSTGGILGGFDSVSVVGLSPSLTIAPLPDPSTGSFMIAAVVPEPGAWCYLTLVAAGLLGRTRRSTRQTWHV